MGKLFGKELAESIKKRRQIYVESMQRREQRVANCETDYDDCFMSERVESQAIDECNKQLEILKGDGLMDYEAIVDENGEEVNVHCFENKWRSLSYVGRGVFASSINALLKKTGWKKKTIRVPVWTRFECGAGGGMCAVYSGYYTYCRWHTNMVTGEYFGYPN